MPTEAKAFWCPKDAGYAAEYEDAYALDEARGAVAVADGVSSAIFSREWAALLTAAAVADPPDPAAAAFPGWLAARRADWRAAIAAKKLSYFQRGKLQQCGGAFATFLWATWTPTAAGGLAWTAWATGDCGLIVVRDGRPVDCFPIATSAEMAADPVSVPSADASRDGQITYATRAGVAEPGDLLVVCTDALLGWALAEAEAGTPPDWERFWAMDADGFTAFVQGLRDEGRIRVDDTTLVVLRVVPAAVEGEAAATFPAAADAPAGDEPDAAVVATSDEAASPVDAVGHGPAVADAAVEAPADPAAAPASAGAADAD